jgi:hypothetical protein
LAQPVNEERIRHFDQQKVALELDPGGGRQPSLKCFGWHLTLQMLENLLPQSSRTARAHAGQTLLEFAIKPLISLVIHTAFHMRYSVNDSI